jgi:hypothetical protein
MNPQQYLLFKLQRLAHLLADRGHNGTSPMLYTVLKEVRLASARWQGGEPFEECLAFTLRRLSWRVAEALSSQSNLDMALQLLSSIVSHGMRLFQEIDACADDPGKRVLVDSFVAEFAGTGFDLRMYMKQPRLYDG